jgi:hypothetical protein
LIAFGIASSIFLFVQFLHPWWYGVPTPNYTEWEDDAVLRQCIPMASAAITFGVIGLYVSMWPVWGGWTIPVVSVTLLTGVKVLNVL